MAPRSLSRTRLTFIVSVLVGLLLPVLSATDILSQAPDSVSFQGILTDSGGSPLNTTTPMTFKLYKDGTAVWTETQPSVVVTDGMFNVLLGSVTPLDTVAFNQPLEIGIKVGADPEMSPKTPLAAAPYALGMRGMYAFWAGDGTFESLNVIGGDPNNSVAADMTGAAIGGGGGTWSGDPVPNTVTHHFGTIGGGMANEAGGFVSTVGGGRHNKATAGQSTVSGGIVNTAGGLGAAIGGGGSNKATGANSTVPGGGSNSARGSHSFAAGFNARPQHEGSFVWSDRSSLLGADSVATTAANQFVIRAVGGVGIGTSSPKPGVSIARPTQAAAYQLELRNVGNIAGGNFDGIAFTQAAGGTTELASIKVPYHNNGRPDMSFSVRDAADALFIEGSSGHIGIGTTSPAHPLHIGADATNGNGAHVTITGTWTNGSSRTFKDGFEEIDKIDVLERLAALPVTKWRYRGEDESEHIGPTAEDFREAFGLGHDERYITTVDADGVALAAVQGLYELVVALQAEVAALKAER